MAVKDVSIKDIALVLGISPSTVSVVLNHNGDRMRISKETQQKVFDTAHQMGYKKDTALKRTARNMSSTRVVAIFWATFPSSIISGNHLWNDFLKGLSEFNQESEIKYELCIHPFQINHLADHYEYIFNSFYNGIIFVGLSQIDEAYLASLDISTPYVAFNRSANQYFSVEVNHYEIGEQAADNLLLNGSLAPAIISSSMAIRSSNLRQLGFIDACLKAGISRDSLFETKCNLSPEDICEAINQLLSHDPRPDGLFISNDDMILPILNTLKKNSVEIPRDMRIISYGDHFANECLSPTITNICMPTEKMSYDCLAVLNSLINGISPLGTSIVHRATCIYRQSCPQPK